MQAFGGKNNISGKRSKIILDPDWALLWDSAGREHERFGDALTLWPAWGTAGEEECEEGGVEEWSQQRKTTTTEKRWCGTVGKLKI